MGQTQKKVQFSHQSNIFDTLACVKRLVEAGVPEKQAEAEAKEFAMLANDHLATKEDITDIKKDIQNIKENMATKVEIANLKSDLANLKSELLKIIGNTSMAPTSFSIVALGALMTIFKFIN